jgi:2-keto-4-pentenoate hydratase/2-oxohepta-3-ene-1,7-dioic acid hydratase in catechol pathway
VRLAVLSDHRVVALISDDEAVDVTALLRTHVDGPPAVADLGDVLGGYLDRADLVRQHAADASTPRLALADLRLIAPVPAPRTVLAAPVNYDDHRGELGDRSPQKRELDARQMGLIVLASGSVTGPGGAIELPDLPGREFHFEGEIAVVIGREARNVPEEKALEHVLGYTGLLDITLRLGGGLQEERSMRKSFATFTPIGPCILTADEAGDPADLGLRLSLNGEVRQQGVLRDLIVTVPQLVARASQMLPLLPGDLIATGTPSGVGPIVPGDELELTVSGVGPLRMPVTRRSW